MTELREVAETPPPARRRAGRPPRWPWHEWLDGEDKMLSAPRDFGLHVNAENLRSQILNEARKRRLVLETQLIRGGSGHDSIGIRFLTTKAVDWDDVVAAARGEGFVFAPGVNYTGPMYQIKAAIMRELDLRGIDAKHVEMRTAPDGQFAIRIREPKEGS